MPSWLFPVRERDVLACPVRLLIRVGFPPNPEFPSHVSRVTDCVTRCPRTGLASGKTLSRSHLASPTWCERVRYWIDSGFAATIELSQDTCERRCCWATVGLEWVSKRGVQLERGGVQKSPDPRAADIITTQIGPGSQCPVIPKSVTSLALSECLCYHLVTMEPLSRQCHCSGHPLMGLQYIVALLKAEFNDEDPTALEVIVWQGE